jgi:hypothetical protein
MTLTLDPPPSATATATVPVIVSLLDETHVDTRLHGTPVLVRLIARLVHHGFHVIVLARPDQAHAIPESLEARVEWADASCGPETSARRVALRWLDGWRGGLLRTSHFDRGLDAGAMLDLFNRLDIHQAVLLDQASLFFDAGILRELHHRLGATDQFSLAFCPAVPGVAACAMSRPFLERLIASRATVGTALSYTPAAPAPDPLSSPVCVNAPKPLTQTQTSLRVTPGNVPQIERLVSARDLDNDRIDPVVLVDALALTPQPRDITVELTTRRLCRPVDWEPVDRPDLDPDRAEAIFADIARAGARLTLGGVGDPVLHPQFSRIVAAARHAGVDAIHVQTDLLADDPSMLASAGVDIVSIHLPAMSASTYETVMGVDGYTRVLEHLKQLIASRARNGSMTPILVPTFTKLQANLGEMESWYDQWLRALGAAAIIAPGDPALAVADMTPPRRRPCVRLAQRLTVLSNGRSTTCDVDCHGRQSIHADPLDAWQQLDGVRADHASGAWDRHPVCATCRAWHQL